MSKSAVLFVLDTGIYFNRMAKYGKKLMLRLLRRHGGERPIAASKA